MSDTNITPPQGSLTASGAVMRVITIGLVLMGASPVLGTTLIPSTGTLTFGVPIPNTSIQPSAGSLSFQGRNPTVTQLALETKLRFQGYAPNVGGQNTTLTPDKGTLVLGTTPDLNVTKSVPIGSLTCTGYLPGVINPAVKLPDVGILSLQGFVPVLSQGPLPPTASGLTVAGYAPILDRGYIPAAGSLKCTPSTTIAWAANTEPDLAGYNVYHGVVSHTYTSHVDVGLVTHYVWENLPDGTNYFAVTAYDTAVPPNESAFSDEVSTVISGRGYAPTITINTPSGTQLQTALGSLSLNGLAPVVNLGIIPPSGSLVLTGNLAPPDTGTLILTGRQPGVTMGGPLNFTVVPGQGILTLVGYTKLQYAEPAWGVLTLQGYTPTVSVQILGSVAVTPPAGSLIFFAPIPFNPNFAKEANSILGPGGVPTNA